MQKREKGITLVALVITIIILLILAGISITSLSNSGLFKNSKEAKIKSEESQIVEEVKLAYNSVQINASINGWDNDKKAQELEEELKKEYSNSKVVAVEIYLFVSYKGYEITIDSEGVITIEDASIGEKPTGEVHILTTQEEEVEEVEIQVIASTTDGEIKSIEALNGASLKTENSNEDKIFKVTRNGKYYFRITGTNKRTTIVSSDEINNIAIVIEAESLLDGVSKITSGGKNKVRVKDATDGTATESIDYSLNVIKISNDLVLDGNKSVEGATLTENDAGEFIYEFGDENDVAKGAIDAQNTVVLKVDGNLTINEGVQLTTISSGKNDSGPKGLIVYCTGTILNNGTITMTGRGAYAEGENVYLWKNTATDFIYVPKYGANGGGGASATNNGDTSVTNYGAAGVNRSKS